MSKDPGAADIGKRLRTLRGEMNQRTFAERLEVSQQAISNYEQGNVPSSWEFLKRLSRDWSINLHWLLEGQGPRELNAGSALAGLSDNRAADWPRAFLDQMVFEETETLELVLHYFFLYLVTEPADVKAYAMGDLRKLVEAARANMECRGASDQERAVIGAAYDALAKDDRRALIAALLAAGEWREAVEKRRALPRARQLYLAALGLARFQGWREQELESARRIGRSYRKEGRWHDAEFFFRIAIATFEEPQARWGEAPPRGGRADVGNGRPEESAAVAQPSGGVAVSSNVGVPMPARARTLLGYGHVAREQGDIPLARVRYMAALRWALESQDPALRAEVYLDLACLSYREKDLKKAGEFVDTGRTFAERAEDPKLVRLYDHAEALVLRERGQPREAEAIFRRVTTQAQATGDLLAFSIASLNLAQVLADQDRFDEAADVLTTSAPLAEENGNPRDLALRMLLRSRIAAAKGENAESAALVLDCMRFARDQGLAAEFEEAAAYWTSRQLSPAKPAIRAI